MLTTASNGFVADALDRVAALLEAQGASPYRAKAYLEAGRFVRGLDRPLAEILQEAGQKGLIALPHIGKAIAAAIEELVTSGQLRLLARLEGDLGCEALLVSLTGIGPTLAHRAHEQLGVETLEDLEIVAHDGRLERVPGFGPGRARAIREMLAARLRRRGPRPAQAPDPRQEPSVEMLLEVDRRYRQEAAANRLPRIAPRRFNPTHDRWLPILHADEGGYHMTVLFSNTARAHQLGHTHDWVVVFHERDGHEGQHTVVTEHRGPLSSQRVVRGRESECTEYYDRRLREAG